MSLHPQTSPSVELSQDDVRVNGLRLAGGFIDILVLAGVFLAIAVSTGHLDTESASTGSSLHVSLSGGPLALCLAIWLAYFWVLEASFGRTLGKLACGLRVIDRAGQTPGPGAVLIRTVGRIIDALPAFYLVGLITMFAGGLPSQRVGDRMAGTAVVRG